MRSGPPLALALALMVACSSKTRTEGSGPGGSACSGAHAQSFSGEETSIPDVGGYSFVVTGQSSGELMLDVTCASDSTHSVATGIVAPAGAHEIVEVPADGLKIDIQYFAPGLSIVVSPL